MSIIANGRLVEYTNSPCSLQVFESGLIGAGNVIVMLGGLTDGLMACSYVPKLSSLCAESGYALLQPILRSSYCQFGTGTLIRDMDDLINLFKWINKRSENNSKVILMGHSTGCNISVYFCKHAPDTWKNMVCGAILQAPVSDREAFAIEQPPQTIKDILEVSKKLISNGEGQTIVHSLYGIAPLSAARAIDLFEKNGLDDMFSSDFTDEELCSRIGHMFDFPTLFVISLSDEYVPEFVYPKLGLRFKETVPGSSLCMIEGAIHSLASPEQAASQFLNASLEHAAVCFSNRR